MQNVIFEVRNRRGLGFLLQTAGLDDPLVMGFAREVAEPLYRLKDDAEGALG